MQAELFLLAVALQGAIAGALLNGVDGGGLGAVAWRLWQRMRGSDSRIRLGSSTTASPSGCRGARSKPASPRGGLFRSPAPAASLTWPWWRRAEPLDIVLKLGPAAADLVDGDDDSVRAVVRRRFSPPRLLSPPAAALTLSLPQSAGLPKMTMGPQLARRRRRGSRPPRGPQIWWDGGGLAGGCKI